MQLSWYVIQQVIKFMLIKLRWFQCNSAHTTSCTNRPTQRLMCITLPKIWATYSFKKVITFNTHGQTHIRDRKYTGFPITFVHTGVLVYEWHVSYTIHIALYHVHRPDNYSFASRTCTYHNRSSTVLMLHDPHAQQNENQEIQNNNFAECFVLA